MGRFDFRVNASVLFGALVLAFVAGARDGRAYDEIVVAKGGKIAGRVRFSGSVPKLPEMVVRKNNEFCGSSKENEALVVGKDGGVKSAVGYLDKITGGKAIDPNAAQRMAAVKCAFAPHVIAVCKGERIEISNEDSVLHNINVSVEGVQRFNKAQPAQNRAIQARLMQTGVAEITCDSHVHMHGWGLVLDHPYFAVSDDSGAFEIDNVPPGRHTLKVWHEPWKIKGKDEDGRFIWDAPAELSRTVEVRAGETTRVIFELK